MFNLIFGLAKGYVLFVIGSFLFYQCSAKADVLPALQGVMQ